MDLLLSNLPPVATGTPDEQARDIYNLLTKAEKRGVHSCWYRVTGGGNIAPSVKAALESKGYTVRDQTKYDLKWINGVPIRGSQHVRYWIGVPGRP